MAGQIWKADTLYLYVFNVERGLSVFLRTPEGFGIIYDLGVSEGFSPVDFVMKELWPYLGHIRVRETKNGKTEDVDYRIGQLFLSHPHNDHISEIKKVSRDYHKDKLYAKLLTCPHDLTADEAFDFTTMGEAQKTDELKHYKELYAKRQPPLQVLDPRIIPGGSKMEYGLYYMRPPAIKESIAKDGQPYINGSSLCVYLHYNGNSVLLTGDIVPEVMKQVLSGGKNIEHRYYAGPAQFKDGWHKSTGDQPSLSTCLKKLGLTVLVAPHHGLESGYCPQLFNTMKDQKPSFTIISDKRKVADAGVGKTDARYQSKDGAKGVKVDVNGEVKDQYSLGTQSGLNFLVAFDADGSVRYYARSEAKDLVGLK